MTSKTLRLRQDHVVWRTFGRQMVVLDLNRSLYLQVNGTGSLLWTALSEGTTRTELVRTLMSAFDLDHAAAAADVDTFLDALRRQDLLVEP
jgi:hypothetical protein